MRLFLAFLTLCALFPFSANAADKEARRCTLKNTELCGDWNADHVSMTVFGHRLEWDNGDYADCTILKEEHHENRFYSLLDCKTTVEYKGTDENGETKTIRESFRDFSLLILRPRKYPRNWDRPNTKYMRLFLYGNLIVRSRVHRMT